MLKKPIRNRVARAPIMRKGGVHEKSNKAKRQQEKQSFKQKLRARDYGPFLCLLIKRSVRQFTLSAG